MPFTSQTSVIANKRRGRGLGKKNALTLEKEAVMKEYTQRVMQSAGRLLDYQMALARGLTYLFKIEKEPVKTVRGKVKFYRAKKPELVTDVNEIRAYLEGMIDNGDWDDKNDPSATYYYITSKDPDQNAIDSMLNRSFGRPTQAVDLDVTTAGQKLKVFDESQLRRIATRVVNAGKPIDK